jgi:hypothetical protein
VPTPGPYSTKSLHSFQSTASSTLVIVRRDDGTIEPTITGLRRNPSKKTPQGPSSRFTRRLIFCGSASSGELGSGHAGVGPCVIRGSLMARSGMLI